MSESTRLRTDVENHDPDHHGLHNDEREQINWLTNLVAGDGLAFAAVVTPEAHGAVGDGTTNDTAAFTAALTAIEAQGGGQLRLADKTTYRVSSIVHAGDNVLIQGGQQSKIRSSLPVATTSPVIHLEGNNVHVWDVDIDYVTPIDIDTDAAQIYTNSSPASTIRLGDLDDGNDKAYGSIVRCRVKNSRNTAFHVTHVDQVRIIDCHAEEVGQGVCVVSSPTGDVIVRGTTVRRTLDDGIAILGDSSIPDSLNRQVIVEGNAVREGYSQGIDCSGIDGAVIANNVVENTYGPGIAAFQYSGPGPTGPCKRTVIANNVVRRFNYNWGVGQYRTTAYSGGGAISVGDADSVAITGNVVYDAAGPGIWLDSVVEVTVTGNNVSECTGLGISVSASNRSSRGVTISGNVVYRTQGGIYPLGNATYDIEDIAIVGNTVRTYKIGSGTWRGIFIAYLTKFTIVGNVVDATGGGDEPYVEYPAASCTGGSIANNPGINPVGPVAAPTLSYYENIPNPFNVPATVYLTGGSVSAVILTGVGGGVSIGVTSGPIRVPAGAQIQVQGSGAAWVWFLD